MSDSPMGYYQYPENSDGIIWARTTGEVRSWEFARSMKTLEKLNDELYRIEFPSVYLLFDGKKVYVGEAKNIYTRLKTHTSKPEEKIEGWDRVIIVNDGRPATQSDFNDAVIRKTLELYLIRLFKTNKYTVVSQGEHQGLNAMQYHIADTLKKELLYLFISKTIITKDIEKTVEEEIFPDELKKIIEKSGKNIQAWKMAKATIDDEKVFIRPGSKKSKGWQVTIRGRKPGSFIDSFKKGKGVMLLRRDGVLYIPLSEMQKVILDKRAYEQDTIDVYIVFEDDKAILWYKDNSIDVTKYKLLT